MFSSANGQSLKIEVSTSFLKACAESSTDRLVPFEKYHSSSFITSGQVIPRMIKLDC